MVAAGLLRVALGGDLFCYGVGLYHNKYAAPPVCMHVH